jgi:tRNA pseudouridine55 synthase
MNGIVVVNKPEGLSSARALARVKRLLQVRKAGHTGTLDPLARGVLVCCLNQATRLAGFLLESPKTYEAVLTLGIETDTQDSTGRITTARDATTVSEEDLRCVVQRYEGAYHQTPPVYSALKHDGVPLYALVRRGRVIQKPARTVFIYGIRVLAVDLPRVRFEVCCSAGTYVRTLCADIGRDLGCGGHLSALTRLASGGFTLGDALTLEELEDQVRRGAVRQVVIPMARALPEIPAVIASPLVAERVRTGRPLTVEDLGMEKTPTARPAGQRALLKLVNAHGGLLAVLEQPPGSHTLDYRCVFLRPEG